MSSVDLLSDVLTIIRNGQKAGREVVYTPHSKLTASVLEVLKKEGYIEDFNSDESGQFKRLAIKLKYYRGKGVINVLKRVSKPSRRVYYGCDSLYKFYNGLGVLILSTPKGVMSDSDAKASRVGGELLCEVF